MYQHAPNRIHSGEEKESSDLERKIAALFLLPKV